MSANAQAKLKVIVADDNSVLTMAICKLLELLPDMECVGSLSEGSEVVDAAAALRPDVLVIDLGLPGVNTVDIIRQLHSHAPATRVIIYSGREDDGGTLDAGAWKFVRKDGNIDQLISTIRQVAGDPQPAVS